MKESTINKTPFSNLTPEEQSQTNHLPLSATDFREIQGLIVRGYGQLTSACFGLFRITHPVQACQALVKLQSKLTFADQRPQQQAINLAWTYHGLRQLQIESNILDQFSDEFRSGISTPHKRRILGDEHANAPENWLWGGPDSPDIDLVMLFYADSQNRLEKLYQETLNELVESGWAEVTKLDSQFLPNHKEHFGFTDSIGQPYIAEFDTNNNNLGESPAVAMGEILLGYPNGYNRYTQRPLVNSSEDKDNLLPNASENSANKDLGKNGSYLVLRQMEQDVSGFWNYLLKQANQNPEAAINLASKMVGRWPSGTSLVASPHQDDPTVVNKDDFAYHDKDPNGFRCPLGAHIRRTNPRDSLEPEPGTEKSIAFSNRHRILRRGRPYGNPVNKNVDIREFLQQLAASKATEQAERGLHFICVNANIGRQFEFVQHTWANNPNFNGLYQDPDPIIGSRQSYGLPRNQFTEQQEPVRCQFREMPEFVKVKGGGYFFLPSRAAQAYILSCGLNAR